MYVQAELAAAHAQIHRSEDRLRDSVAHLTALEGSVRRTFGASAWTDGPAVAPADAQPAADAAAPAAAAAAVQAAQAAAPAVARPQQRQRTAPLRQAQPAQEAAAQQQRGGGGRAGLASRGRPGLAIPEQLKDFWFPVEFAASLGEGRMVPFELFGEVGPGCRRCCRGWCSLPPLLPLPPLLLPAAARSA